MVSSHNWPFIINLGNSIIGVALLAMPFCFQKCGIVLSMLVLFFCTWLTLISCQLLMKAGVTSRRRSYEFLAYHTHGATGKFVSEIGMIGFQLGTLIAQIVVIGDLGPSIVTKIFGIENTPGLRTSLIILLCMTIGLPMALVKDIRAISKVSAVCVAFYCTFVVYVLWLSLPNIWSGNWYQKVHFWRPQGLFQSLPILSFSFGCQTQLFLLYDALPEPSLKAMSKVVNCAVNLCAVAYLMVGFCGYVAFYAHDIPGDVIGVFPNIFFTDLMKVCFVFSIVITFPVIVFPCRASIYTLLFAKLNQDDSFHPIDDEKKSKARDDVVDLDTYMPAKQLKIITISLVVGSMIIGILIPNVEFILGMNGAIMGTLICYIFPALFFLKVMGNNPESKNRAQLVLFVGVAILLVSTYATLRSQDKGSTRVDKLAPVVPIPVDFENVLVAKPLNVDESKIVAPENGESATKRSDMNDVNNNEVIGDVRKEPPNPNPPINGGKPLGGLKVDDTINVKRGVIDEGAKLLKEVADSGKPSVSESGKVATIATDKVTVVDNDKLAVVDSDKLAAANKAKELELQEKEKKQEELLAQLAKQSIEQKMLIEEQKQLLKEFKDHHEKDMKHEVELQPMAQNHPGPILQQPQQQASIQPQVQASQKLEPLVPRQLGQEIQDLQHPNAFQKQINGSNTNQQTIQPKPQQEIVNQVNIPNNSVINQKPQDHLNTMGNTVSPQGQQPQYQQILVSQNPPEIIQQPQYQQILVSQHPPEIVQQPQQEQLQNMQQLQKQQELNQGQQALQSDTQQIEDNVGQAGQQKPQNIEDLNRAKRAINDQSPIVNHTNVPESKEHENNSFNTDKSVLTLHNVTSKENKEITAQDIHNGIGEKTHEKQSDNVSDVNNSIQKPKTNEEMRRKLKSFDSSEIYQSKESVFGNSFYANTFLSEGSRSLLNIKKRKI